MIYGSTMTQFLLTILCTSRESVVVVDSICQPSLSFRWRILSLRHSIFGDDFRVNNVSIFANYFWITSDLVFVNDSIREMQLNFH
jgi:hypothetical protein